MLYSGEYIMFVYFQCFRKMTLHLLYNCFKLRLGFHKCSSQCTKPRDAEILVWSFRKHYFLNNHREKNIVSLKTSREDDSLGNEHGYWFNNDYSQKTVPVLNPPWYTLNSFSLFLISSKSEQLRSYHNISCI